jgi:hypothetical protein
VKSLFCHENEAAATESGNLLRDIMCRDLLETPSSNPSDDYKGKGVLAERITGQWLDIK